MNRKAAIFAVGAEVVHGFIINSNAAWMARELSQLGFDVQYHLALTDREADIVAAMREALAEGCLVISSGGIGPTVDDRTREAAAKALGVPLELDHDDLARLHDRYAAMGRRFPEGSERQCMRPAGARLILNAFGTASCFLARKGEGGIAVLPGVPRELKGIWAEELRAALIEEFGLEAAWQSRQLMVFGAPESDLNNRVRDLLERTDAEGAILVDDAVIRLRWRVRGDAALLEPILAEARRRLGDLVFADAEETLEGATVRLLNETGQRVACAESCTGGMVSHLLTNVPGSSNVLLEGAVTYSNEAKQRRLGVQAETLAQHGAVSEACALEMARGMLRDSGADITIATTGIAGPGGGTDDKPVGTVWIAAAMRDTARAWKLRVPGDRELVKWRSARTALNTLRLAALHGKLPEQIAHWVTPP